MKRIISIILSIVLLFSVSTVNAQEAETSTDSLLNKEIQSSNVEYSFKNGVLLVKGTGVVKRNYTSICKQSAIKKVVIKSGITGIADYAFDGCTNMTEVELPKTLKYIGCRAFAYAKIETLTVPNSVKKIGEAAFMQTKKIKKVSMPAKFEYVNIIYRDDEDNYCESRFLFGGSRVEALYLNTEFEPKNMDLFLADKIYTSKKDTKYKSYDGMVYSKNGKTLVMVPERTKKLNVREGCKTIKISSFTYSYRVQGEPIPYCRNLKQITIPSSVKCVVKDITEEMNLGFFDQCKFVINSKVLTGQSIENLSEFVSKKTAKQWLKQKKFGIKKNNQMYISADNDLLKYTGSKTKVKIPVYVKRIGAYAFSNKKIKSIVLTKNIKSIGNHAFYRCKKLKKITWNKKLKKVGNFAFAQTKLQELKLPDLVKNWGDHCFADCKFKKVTFPKTMTKVPERMFEGVTIDKLVIPGTVKTIGRYAFTRGSYNTVIMKEGVRKISLGAFDECYKIQSMVLPKSLEVIADTAFRDAIIGKVTIKNPDVVFGGDCFLEVGEFVLETTPDKYFTYAGFRSLESNGTLKLFVSKVQGASGLQVECSLYKDFSQSKVFDIENKAQDVIIKTGLGNNQNMVINLNMRIRPYTKKDGKIVYGVWQMVD